ncbi:MAG: hypothetical protein A3F40_03625 [Chlamydiae bacterium RIFCSPHIGHO2_12_FULL_27_8]|nr:MAG: hypothetical protein A3F40_03625 [Chlamydiae bacterium RIFCSPHIGHO2_12_FULL_27_8]
MINKIFNYNIDKKIYLNNLKRNFEALKIEKEEKLQKIISIIEPDRFLSKDNILMALVKIKTLESVNYP